MDDKNIYMDNFYKNMLSNRMIFSAHTGAFSRRFSVLPALDAIGYIPEKRDWIDTEFPTWNFSIILSGNGTYIAEGKEYPVISPCVLTQQPGFHTNYGPASSWEELFFIYDKEAADTLIRGNVFPGKHESPIWRFNDTGTTMASIRQLAEALDLLKYQQYAGNIDFLAYEIIISTINNPYREKVSRSVNDDFTKILTVEKSMRINPAKLIDIDQTSVANDMHPAKFRRLWNVLFKDPPIRHLQKLRLMQSAKLLAETKMQIQEIADITGFQDSLYFSRQFKRQYGLSPKYYREKYTESLIMDLPE
jgi:AraC-like DNA-binding protein